MTFKEILPGQQLRPYIKGFFYYEADSSVNFDDVVFPSGNMEVIFNMGDGRWKAKQDSTFYTTPPIELWGQLTRPLAIQSVGKNIMLGIRFHPHSAAYFFDEDVSAINNEIVHAADVFGASIKKIHAQLLALSDLKDQIALVEQYLLDRLVVTEKNHDKIKFIGEIANSLKNNTDNEKILSVSIRNNISTRYLSQLFSQYTGLAPKLFHKINRFQHSLSLINSTEQKLTSIAYDAGYFDQSHFIREFKLFTGTTPSSFSAQAFPISQLLVNN